MPRKKGEKNITLLKPSFSEIISLSSESFRPFVEIFIHEPENLTQQNLGTLFGVLEVKDDSEDSSYIVNYIASNVKKEFYKNPRRGSVESFESALHKANLSLSKLAQHENISWIGKFNAFFGVIEKNNLHFSLAGNITALLLRNKGLSDMGDGMTEDGKNNPLKTFTDIASGKLEESDRLILSTPEISDVFSNEEIKKSFLRFSGEKFVQFLKTALSGELPRVATLIVEVSRKEAAPSRISSKKEKGMNAWSQKSFLPDKNTLKEKIIRETEKNDPSQKSPGHIYMKESESLGKESSGSSLEIFRDVLDETKNKLTSLPKTVKKNTLDKKPGLSDAAKIMKETGKNLSSISREISKKIGALSVQITRNLPSLRKRFSFKLPNFSPLKKLLVSFIPYFKKSTSAFSRLSLRNKIIISSAAVAVLIILLIIITRKDTPASEPIQNIPDSQASMPVDGAASSEGTFEVISKDDGFHDMALTAEGKLFGSKNSSLYSFEEDKDYPIDPLLGKIKNISYMEDLNLIFVLTDQNKIISFSPTTGKFQENNINLPDKSSLQIAGAYLTYLYILDPEEDRIIRYPRAEGGFGEGTDWLKETSSIENISSSAINENIFLIQDGTIAKYWRGKKQSFPEIKEFSPTSISSFEDSPKVFILDNQSGTILTTDNEGNIESNHPNNNLLSSEKLLVDSKNNNKFYLISKEGKVSSITF